MATAIQVEGVSKVYRLGQLDRGVFFRDLKHRLRGDFRELQEDDPKLFWALRDISFRFEEGEIIGLLGRNGAGKSTLLRLLAQITSPTRGRVCLRGRVASMLEVGTGFHGELTGRENIFQNGLILGMRRSEVQRKLDEIIAFSGVENFLDTPVKHYSSGMRVRLAFAVAAHLEPEILLVDEVLTVGDTVFQNKCLGKLGEVSRDGRTVVLVSHNHASIEALCTRGILLERGRLLYDGTAIGAVEASAQARASLVNRLGERDDREGSGALRVVGLHLRKPDGAALLSVRAGVPVDLVLEVERKSTTPIPRLSAQVTIGTQLGVPIFTHGSWLTGTHFGDLPERFSLVCHIPRLPVVPGHYQIGYRLETQAPPAGTTVDALESASELMVEGGDFFGTGRMPGPRDGVTLVDAEWRLGDPAASAT